MKLRRKGQREAPTVESVEAEAAQFRQESQDLRDELAALRSEINVTTNELIAFSQAMKEISP